jgi:hypothetical protein
MMTKRTKKKKKSSLVTCLCGTLHASHGIGLHPDERINETISKCDRPVSIQQAMETL